MFWAVNVYSIGVEDPAATWLGVAALETTKSAGTVKLAAESEFSRVKNCDPPLARPPSVKLTVPESSLAAMALKLTFGPS